MESGWKPSLASSVILSSQTNRSLQPGNRTWTGSILFSVCFFLADMAIFSHRQSFGKNCHKNNGPTRGGSHQRSHCLEKQIVQPGRKKWSQRCGSHQRSHCLGKMVQPVVGVTSEVTVFGKHGPTRGVSHRRSRCFDNNWSHPEEFFLIKPLRESTAKSLRWEKMVQTVVGVNSEGHCLGSP